MKCDGGDVVNDIRLTTSTILMFHCATYCTGRYSIRLPRCRMSSFTSDEYVNCEDIHVVNIATMCANDNVVPQRGGWDIFVA
jgi:hypothetical protein